MRRYVTVVREDTKCDKRTKKKSIKKYTRSLYDDPELLYTGLVGDDGFDFNELDFDDPVEEEDDTPILYFAYGSNMCIAQMNRRCPSNTKMGKAVLSKHKWIISTRGYANVVHAKKHKVEGVLYAVRKKDVKALDIYEGVRSGAYDKDILPVEFEGRTYEALVYIGEVVDEGVVKKSYAERINAGVKDAKLSPTYVSKYIRKFIPATITQRI